MPKVNYLKPRPEEDCPPIDWLWAAILERKTVLGYDLKRMAAVAGVHYDTMRDYIRKSPWKWNPEVRKRICDEFGISTKVAISQVEMPQESKVRRTRL